ncbi:MAG: protein kinase [Polyangiaceae bacterium]|nr:protein kinase [Polyangiaceae bacterium]
MPHLIFRRGLSHSGGLMRDEGDRGAGRTDPPETDPAAPRSAVPSAPPISNGKVLAGRYEVRELVGMGGMGTVYRAFDRELREDVALKILRPDRLGDSASVERFRREARLARKIGHPNVCRVFDLGEVDGHKFMTMEWVPGRSLGSISRGRKLSPARALALFRQIVSGVAAAHELGIVHRDLKPDNVLITLDGRAKVADFGLALFDLAELTTAVGAGTPPYMSPEQLRGVGVGKASDVFSLGIVGFEMFVGSSPFGEGLPMVVASAILRDPPRPFLCDGLPADIHGKLAALLSKALQKDAAERIVDAQVLLQELQGIGELGEDAAGGLPAGDSVATAAGEAALVRASKGAGGGSSSGSGALLTAARSISKGGSGPLRRRWLTAAGLLAGLVGAGLAARALVPPANVSPTPPVLSSSGTAAQVGFGLEAAVLVVDFEDLARDEGWAGLTQTAGEAVRAALRGIPGVRVLRANSPEGAPTWTVHGSVQRIGRDARISARFEAQGKTIGETVDADGSGVRPQEAIELLKDRVVDEARLLLAEHQRRVRAERETQSDNARQRFLDYLASRSRIVDINARRERVDEVLQLDSSYLSAKLERAELTAQAAGQLQDVDAALQEVDAVLKANPGEPRAAIQRCRYRRYRMSFLPRIDDADLEAAESSCRAALLTDPTSGAVLLTLAKLDATRCDLDSAITHLQDALATDRARGAEILPNISTFALQIGKLPQADVYTNQFVALQETEERLGAHALGKRAGMAAARGAYLLRGGVLFRLGRLEEAKTAFENELRHPRSGPFAEQTEAAALYGLQRAGAPNGLTPPLLQRLHDLEAKPRSNELLMSFAAEISKASPRDALTWIERVRGAQSCAALIVKANILGALNDRPAVNRVLADCKPQTRWEEACVARARER